MKFKKRLKQLQSILDLDTVPEISINYKVRPNQKRKIAMGEDMAEFAQSLFEDGDFDLRERFVVILLDHELNPVGFFNHTIGAMDSVDVDRRMIFQKLILVGGARFVVAHNHPQSPPLPSKEDVEATFYLKHQAEFLDLELVDHIILSREGYYSFNEQDMI